MEEREENKIIRTLNHETLGELSVFKNHLNENGQNLYTLLKINNSSYEPYVVAFRLDEKDGRWQHGAYFSKLEDAEDYFKIATELHNSFYEVKEFVKTYNTYEEEVFGNKYSEREKTTIHEVLTEMDSEVPIMYTTDEDTEEELRMTYDLKTNTYKYYLNERLFAQEKYSLEDVISDLEFCEFDLFYYGATKMVEQYKRGEVVAFTVFYDANEQDESMDNDLLKEKIAQKLNALMYDADPYEYNDNELTSNPIGLNGEGNNYDFCLDMLDKQEYTKIDDILTDILEENEEKEIEDRIYDLNNDLKQLKGIEKKMGIKL